MSKDEKVNSILKKNSIAISLWILGTCLTLAVTLFNLNVASKLAPLAQDLSVTQTKVNALEKEEEKHVNKDEFTQVVTRLDKISGRVDEIIAILIKK